MKKKPTKPLKPVSAPKPLATAENVATGILYAAPGIPAGLSPAGYIPKGETDWRRFHEINVRQNTAGSFQLYDREEICGPRLIKGAGFPLYDTTEIAIWVYANLKEASVAADMLQDYLDNYENKHLEVARKRYEKENALITA